MAQVELSRYQARWLSILAAQALRGEREDSVLHTRNMAAWGALQPAAEWDSEDADPDTGPRDLGGLATTWDREAGYLRAGTATPVGPCAEAMAAQAAAHAQQLRDALAQTDYDG